MKALLIVDVQKGFIDGKLGSAWAQKVTPKIVKFARECRAKGFDIYATADTHSKREFEQTVEGQVLPLHCEDGTTEQKLADGLLADENGNPIIKRGNIFNKGTFISYDLAHKMFWNYVDGSGHTELFDDTRSLGKDECHYGDSGEPLDEIIIVGFVTSICVMGNALNLRSAFPATKITVIENLCADLNEESHKAAIKVLENNFINVETIANED